MSTLCMVLLIMKFSYMLSRKKKRNTPLALGFIVNRASFPYKVLFIYQCKLSSYISDAINIFFIIQIA